MSLQEQLQDIDLQLELMPPKNRLMVYASVLLGVIIFVYYVFGLDLQEEFSQKEQTYLSLEKKLAENKVSSYKNKIAKNQKNILVLAQEYELQNYKETDLIVKLEKLDYLSSDAKGLADILDRLLKRSVILGVKIQKIAVEDKDEEYKAHIKTKGSIVIEGTSGFASVLKLLRFIESQEALIEVKNVHFNLDDANTEPTFVIIITGYGINV